MFWKGNLSTNKYFAVYYLLTLSVLGCKEVNLNEILIYPWKNRFVGMYLFWWFDYYWILIKLIYFRRFMASHKKIEITTKSSHK